MSVSFSAEIAEQRRGPTFRGDGSLDRTYTRVFEVITDNNLTEGLECLIMALAIPPIYSFYDTRPQGGTAFDLGALLVGYDPYQPDRDSPNLWYVRCDYTSYGLDPEKVSQARGAGASPQGGGGYNENPVLKPVKISYRNNNQRRTVYVASGYWQSSPTGDSPFFIDGETPIVNSALQAYNPLPEVPAPQKTLTIVKNMPVYNVRDSMFYEGKTNSVPWLGFPAKTVMCDFIDGESAFDNGIAYTVVTHQFSLRRDNFYPESPGDPWDWPVPDQGSFYFDDDDVEQAFTDSNGNFRSGFLDGFGGKLPDGGSPPLYAFRVLESVDFNALKLP